MIVFSVNRSGSIGYPQGWAEEESPDFPPFINMNKSGCER